MMKLSDNNVAARIAFAAAVRQALCDLNISMKRLADEIDACYSVTAYAVRYGITPTSKYYIPICEALGFYPDDFGFISQGSSHKKRAASVDAEATRKTGKD